MSGKIIKVAVARSSAPSCAPGDWVVKIGQVQGGADKGKYSVAVFAAEHVDEARTFAVALSAAGDPFDVAATSPQERSDPVSSRVRHTVSRVALPCARVY